MLALEVRIFGGFCFATMNVWPFQWWLCGLRLLFRRGGLYTTAVVRQGLDVLFGTPKHRPWFFPPLTLGLIGWLWPIWFVIFGSRLRVDCGLDSPWFQWLLCFPNTFRSSSGAPCGIFIWHIPLRPDIVLTVLKWPASLTIGWDEPKTRAPFSATKRPIKASKAKNMARHLAPHGSDFFYRLLMRKKLQTSDRWRGFRLRMTLRMNSINPVPLLRPPKRVDLQIDHGFWRVFNIKGMELLKTSSFAEGFDILKSCYISISFSIALISSLWGRCNGQVLW